MYIIVVGGGQVGYYLAKALMDEGHELLVLEKDAARTAFICNDLGSVCVRGDGCEMTTLAEAGAGRADMFIAVTGEDEDNLVSCQAAKHKFNVPRTVARINNPKNETIFKKMGIDVTISSTNIIMESIEEEMPTHPLTHLLDIQEQGLEIVEIKIPPHSPAIGKTVKELSLPAGNTLSLIIRSQQKPFVPDKDTILEAEDQIIAITTPESEEALGTTLRGS
ncbi:MAG: TrkA family potassium uptake protein [Dehalococcoidales bacterium]|jgi:trk system potassium uptake protein TrkA|nr:TrkA family potassium uptake protein [Dehalococcoidales bacterium]MCX6011086.1 TrkA family potassium uptake protein [Chloroflexota bacterium]